MHVYIYIYIFGDTVLEPKCIDELLTQVFTVMCRVFVIGEVEMIFFVNVSDVSLSTTDVCHTLRRVNARKAAGPDGVPQECVSNFKFLGIHISEDPTWSLNSSTLVKKAQQRLGP